MVMSPVLGHLHESKPSPWITTKANGFRLNALGDTKRFPKRCTDNNAF